MDTEKGAAPQPTHEWTGMLGTQPQRCVAVSHADEPFDGEDRFVIDGVAGREILRLAAENARLRKYVERLGDRSAQLTSAFETAATALAEAAGDDFWLFDYPPEDKEAISKNLGLLMRKAARNESARVRRKLLAWRSVKRGSLDAASLADDFEEMVDEICPKGGV